MHSRWSPTKGTKTTIDFLETFAFSGAKNWAESLHHPCILKVPTKGVQFRIVHLTPTFSEAHKWGNCYVTQQRG